jgi:hypothetical protein
MMKTFRLALIGIFSASSLISVAQDYAFKVLANKGTNEVKTGDTWQPLKTGTSLQATDEIKIASNSYLGLVHKTGKPLEIKEPSIHKVSDLARNISGGSSVVTKYTDFILSSNSAEAKKNRLSATGAVHRGEPELGVHLPENQHSAIFNDKAIISWDNAVPGPYELTFKNMFDDELFKVETQENSYSVDFNDPKFAKEEQIIVEVKSLSDPKQVSRQHLIKKLSPAAHENIKKSLDLILTEVSEPTATDGSKRAYGVKQAYPRRIL